MSSDNLSGDGPLVFDRNSYIERYRAVGIAHIATIAGFNMGTPLPIFTSIALDRIGATDIVSDSAELPIGLVAGAVALTGIGGLIDVRRRLRSRPAVR